MSGSWRPTSTALSATAPRSTLPLPVSYAHTLRHGEAHINRVRLDAPPDGYTRSGTPTPLPEFSALSSRWKSLNPTGVKASNYNPTLTPPPCPAFTSDVWAVDAKSGLPSLGQTYEAAKASASTTGSGGNSQPTGQQGSSGGAGSAPSGKGAASALSDSTFQTMGLVLAAFAGICIWL